MSKKAIDRLGWDIEESTKMVYITADGTRATPLGKIREVPIKIGGATIPVDVIVTSATNYDILIGNQWLHKARAIIDLNAQKMQINYRGRKV
jgi:predicted aspartyl protease